MLRNTEFFLLRKAFRCYAASLRISVEKVFQSWLLYECGLLHGVCYDVAHLQEAASVLAECFVDNFICCVHDARHIAPKPKRFVSHGKAAELLHVWFVELKRVLEEVFDVTPLVRPGAENELRIELGNGWWNLSPLKMWYSYELWKILPQGEPAVNATLDILYSDGRRESIETGIDWLSGKGKIVKNSIYLGVKEDAGLVSDCEWSAAQKASGPKGGIFPAGDFPKTVVYDRWNAKSVRQVMKGVWVVDFGVNFAGTFRAKLRGVPRGHLVTFRAGERLNDDKTVNVSTAVAGQIKNPDRGPLFDVAEQRNEWVSPGPVETVFEPRFTFHVFRYVQIAGLPSAPSPKDFEALSWSADVEDGAHFECSDKKLNTLHQVCRRTFRANLQSVQSDCPGREKFGYGGDIAGVAESFRVNWKMAPFYRKAIRDFLDEAADDGFLTETAPYVGIGSKPVIPKEETGSRAISPMGCLVLRSSFSRSSLIKVSPPEFPWHSAHTVPPARPSYAYWKDCHSPCT